MSRLATAAVIAATLVLGSSAPADTGAEQQMTEEILAAFASAVGPSDEAAGGIAGAPCPGDCDGNGVVSIDEIVRGVVIANGFAPVSNCPAFDTNNNGAVTINELIAAVGRALEGCTGSGPVSVCGGPITSAPKLCNLSVQPARVEAGRTVTSFGMSDLEGDITTICLGLGRVGGTGMEQCNPLEPLGQTVNLVAELPGVPVNLAPGDYEMAVLVIDSTEARSNIITARFTVFRIRR